MQSSDTTFRGRVPLYTQVLIAAGFGLTLGLWFGQDAYLGELGNEHLGWFGLIIVQLLKVLALPLIVFAILDTFVHASLPFRQGVRLIGISLVNVSVAMAIGLVIMNTWQPGLAWQSRVDDLLRTISPTPSLSTSGADAAPPRIVALAAENPVIAAVLAALILGASIRVMRRYPEARRTVQVLGWLIDRGYRLLKRLLGWIIMAVPLAVFGVLAHVVGRSGPDIFSALWIFLAATMLGLLTHALVYYPLVAWLVGRKPPRVYFGEGADAIATALSCNSSLATVPVTLRCLERMRVSTESARLAACVGTNLNNDGITLYEAMAALFLAQALGYDLSLTAQFMVVMASILAGAGVAGIPEAGLVVLPWVLATAGLPTPIIAAAIPLIMTVDWIIARARSGVNVMSDMLVAILLDRTRERPRRAASTSLAAPVANAPLTPPTP